LPKEEQKILVYSLFLREDNDIIKLSREHNDTNILSLGARFLGEDEAKEAVKLWLETSFSGEERHRRRVGKIDGSEQKD